MFIENTLAEKIRPRVAPEAQPIFSINIRCLWHLLAFIKYLIQLVNYLLGNNINHCANYTTNCQIYQTSG